MDLQGCYEAGKWMYEYASKMEKENKVLSNKVANLERELDAYRTTKDKYEAVIESDKNVIKDYERKIETLTRDKSILEDEVARYKSLYLSSITKSHNDSKVRNTFSKIGSDSNSVDKNTKKERVMGEFRVYKDKNGVLHRYEKVEERNQNGIVLVRWELVD